MKRSIALSFLFLFAAMPAFPFGQNKIVYDQFKWNVYHSTHFDIYFYEEERDALQRVVDSAESAYMELSQKFNYQISKKIPLIFYHSHSAFEQSNVMLNFIPEGVGAFAEPALEIHAAYPDTWFIVNTAEATQTFAHMNSFWASTFWASGTQCALE